MPARHRSARRARRARRAFTLVELLVVVGIIAVLIAILLPVLSGAQRSARDIKCKSNIRQVVLALKNYAAENKGRYPPNIHQHTPPKLWNWWCDSERIGPYLRAGNVASNSPFLDFRNSLRAPVLSCPGDEAATRACAMNYFASCVVSWSGGRIAPPNFAKAGSAWGPGTKPSSKLILVGEMLAYYPDGDGGFVASPTIGSLGSEPDAETRFYPGIAFLGFQTFRPSLTPGLGFRFSSYVTQTDWSRHRRRGDGGREMLEPRGRANFGFADGYVADYTPDDLADRTTRRSKFVALWSPLDQAIERLPRPNGL